jgi:hypothetical protein
MTVDAVVYFRVIDPAAAVVRVENYLKAASLISQTTLRSVLGQAELEFVWSLWNGSHLINLYQLSHGLDGRLADAVIVLFRGAMVEF